VQDVSIHQERVVLTPNQKAVYQIGEEKIKVGIVDGPVLVNLTEGAGKAFIFKDSSLQTVATRLTQAYGVEIVPAANLKDCPITADFSEENFFAKLELICAALQAEYAVDGIRISITGRGCEELKN
jgi:transmembrane sensor